MAHQVHEVPWDLQTNKRLSLLLRYDDVDKKTIPDIMLHLLACSIQAKAQVCVWGAADHITLLPTLTPSSSP